VSGGPEYALRLREVEEENARLRAEVERITLARDLAIEEIGHANERANRRAAPSHAKDEEP
jgi:hypothetical protein